ncbi:hypothetical protein [Marivita sp. S2033]|uniref:hypothetical protein n=1 Tax=Marivita sp. S2033 TaxID=3373187 RepID=UPI003981D729
MQTKLIIAVALSALAMPVIAAQNDTHYALSAVHADFQDQLDRTAERSDAIGAAARAAAGLMAPHSAAQERLVLPLLGGLDAAASGQAAVVSNLPERMELEAELSELHDRDVDLVTALVELYAAAEDAGHSEIARMAERMIWHETSDIEVLYPSALLVGSGQTRPVGNP